LITLKTITTIELSNICNLKCQYCINRLLVKDPAREPGIMIDRVFDKSLELLQELCNRGTQMEVNMNGTGESFLDPHLVKRVKAVKKIMGKRSVCMCTNGVNMTYEICKGLKDAGLDQLDLSPHSAAHARKAAAIMIKVGIPGVLNNGVIVYTHNWAGQLEPKNQVPCMLSFQCDPLIEGRGYVLMCSGKEISRLAVMIIVISACLALSLTMIFLNILSSPLLSVGHAIRRYRQSLWRSLKWKIRSQIKSL